MERAREETTDLLHVGHSRREVGRSLMQAVDWQGTFGVLIVFVAESKSRSPSLSVSDSPGRPPRKAPACDADGPKPWQCTVFLVHPPNIRQRLPSPTGFGLLPATALTPPPAAQDANQQST